MKEKKNEKISNKKLNESLESMWVKNSSHLPIITKIKKNKKK